MTDLPTESQVSQWYIQDRKNGKSGCPYCKQDTANFGEFNESDGVVRCLIECGSCRMAWMEVYEMARVEFFSGDPEPNRTEELG